MYQIEQTTEFTAWLDGLRDRMARKRILMRIERLAIGLFGDWKTVSDGVSELRIDHGPGYRVYYTVRGQTVIILLCGSDKQDQDRAMKFAKRMAKEI
jgi:putative addiction module killer protein